MSAPPRVTHVIIGLDTRGGGPSVALEGLSTQQVSQGAAVRVVGTFPRDNDDSRADRMRAAGVRVDLLGPSRPPLHAPPSIDALVREAVADADIVHIHALWETPQHLAAKHARAAGKPYVVRPCGMLDPWSLSQSRWKKRAMLAWRVRKNLNQAAALHFTSPTEQELTKPLRLKPPGIVEPNGVDVDELSKPIGPALDLRTKHPELRDRPLVLFLSRLHHKKGCEVLIDALAKLDHDWPADRPKPGLAMVGGNETPEYRAALDEQIAKLGLSDRVVFTGLLNGDAKTAALQCADVFCLPSYQENFGIAVVEALAAGTPVAITDQVNIYREVVDAGLGTATAVDADAVSGQLRRWLDDDAGRQRVAQEAGPWVRQRYGWPEIARRWVHEHYPRLIGSPTP